MANTRDEAGHRSEGGVEASVVGCGRAAALGSVPSPDGCSGRAVCVGSDDFHLADGRGGVAGSAARGHGPRGVEGAKEVDGSGVHGGGVRRSLDRAAPAGKDSTKELYRGLLRGCIDPDIGKVKLGAITADTVRVWHYQLGRRLATDIAAERDRLALAGRAPSTATVRDGRTRQAQAYRLLRAAMVTAHGDGLIDEQPCRIAGAGTPRPSVERRDLAERLLTPAQVADVAAEMPPRYRLLVLAAAWSGLRQGELLALTRADLDLEACPPVVRVRRRVRRNDDGSMDVDTPKSAASLRTVALPGPLRDALVDHVREFVSEDTESLVFSRRRRGLFRRGATSPRCCTARLPRRVCRRCGSTTCATARKSWPRNPGRRWLN